MTKKEKNAVANKKWLLKLYDDPIRYENYRRKRREYEAQQRKLPRVKDILKKSARKVVLKKYGLTPESFDALVKSKKGKCDICKCIPKPCGLHSKLVIDHDHLTGNMRGLLCHKCNSALGLLNDSVVLLTKAISYLEANGR